MAEQKLTHWKKMMDNSDYIGAYSFQPGEEKTLTIKSCGVERVHSPDGKTEECMVIHWRENEKPLIANVTNCKMIGKVLGSNYIEQWTGQRIVLGTDKVKAFGDVVEAVRVRNKKAAPVAVPGQPATMCADCGKPITAHGNTSAADVVKRTKEKFGACLCMECGLKRMDGGNA